MFASVVCTRGKCLLWVMRAHYADEMFGVNGMSSKLILNFDDFTIRNRSSYERHTTLWVCRRISPRDPRRRGPGRFGKAPLRLRYAAADFSLCKQTLDKWVAVTTRSVVMCSCFCCSVLA
jgi:hypothetical protein